MEFHRPLSEQINPPMPMHTWSVGNDLNSRGPLHVSCLARHLDKSKRAFAIKSLRRALQNTTLLFLSSPTLPPLHCASGAIVPLGEGSPPILPNASPSPGGRR